jgi:hypothetical protein
MSDQIKCSKSSKPVFKKFCKVCQDAKKSESEYTSHNVRESKDPKSKTLCPTLLAQECRHCFRKGHTVKYCLILKKQQQTAPTSYVGADKKPRRREVLNVFMLLESEGEDEEGDEDECEDEEGDECENEEGDECENEDEEEKEKEDKIPNSPVLAATIAKPVPQIPRVIGKSRWLDVVSSSDEEDESDEEK